MVFPLTYSRVAVIAVPVNKSGLAIFNEASTCHS
jgi:hypothetical protein